MAERKLASRLLPFCAGGGDAPAELEAETVSGSGNAPAEAKTDVEVAFEAFKPMEVGEAVPFFRRRHCPRPVAAIFCSRSVLPSSACVPFLRAPFRPKNGAIGSANRGSAEKRVILLC